MIIRLDLESDTPIYTQLVQQIVEGIASGRLQPGEPLPSVRTLAGDLGINLHTVNKAYQLLKQDGYIQIHRQKGVVVQPQGMPDLTPQYLKKLEGDLRPIIAESIARSMKKNKLIELVEKLHAELSVN
ncbi:GntR family transcriptional regulator [Paenibacillus puerhi]|uniref:GntR family transcriptional regulator n=1 Tax=Paenibacillus puerhi TaxID=2692622 RepID=UPI001356B4DC|nr:GntR family transcriptional regulator [Paenibacillus puerhi]